MMAWMLRYKYARRKDPEGLIDAMNYGSKCSQSNFTNEDCLFINIFTPLLDLEIKSEDSRFFTSKDDTIPGNYAISDMTEALQWTKRYIKFFGGDPNRITICGQSSGAESQILRCMRSATATELQNADMHLPYSHFMQWGTVIDKVYLPDAVENLAMKRPPLSVMGGVTAGEWLLFEQGNIRDHLKSDAYMRQGIIHRLRDLYEMKCWNNYDAILQRTISHYIDSQKVPDDDHVVMAGIWIKLMSDLDFTAAVLRDLKYFATTGSAAYLYSFDYLSPLAWSWLNVTELRLAPHSSDKSYLYEEGCKGYKCQDEDIALRDTIQRCWVNFVLTGNPTPISSGLPFIWPKLDGSNRYVSVMPSPENDSRAKLQNVLKNDRHFQKLRNKFKNLKTDPILDFLRYEKYSEVKKEVDTHNEKFGKGETTYKAEVNKFTVASEDELPPFTLKMPPSSTVFIKDSGKRQKRDENSTSSLSDSVDWRPFMKPILDQESCGGCWAFAMLGMLEGFLKINEKDLSPLSVQQLLDCDRATDSKYGLANGGCDGGYFQVASNFLKNNFVTSGSDYPFTGSSGPSSACITGLPFISPKIITFDTGYVSMSQINNDSIVKLEKDMEDRVRKGPVAVGLATASAMFSYGSGIYDGQCGSSINHAVVIVGFTPDYWIIRNSWGADFGEEGHIRLARKAGSDACMIYRYWAQALKIGDWPQITNETLTTPQASTPLVGLPRKKGV
ncbi:hypothetical protein WR25_24708 isoform C [Diploscapter pachys]|uniref:Peptidase C1A papain C-terminal domain-containing protein n=1 Tax=Diploscapter pachys TaxID=2018661 RepID=A0A2A2L9B4_9BILA|nr:hypothetical protein WR25_24708 isoform C [Diploscapter pachys]